MSVAAPARSRSTVAEHARSSTFRWDIEGLRGLAVLLVVLYHADLAGVRGGYVGVDVFFVISGFLITGMLLGERSSTGTVSFSRFYARRARRLLPSSALVIVAVAVAATIILAPLVVRGVIDDGIASSLFFANFRFAGQDTGYFALQHGPSPFLHFWSLSLEEQFYAVWPAIVLLVGGRGLRPEPATRRRVLGALAVIFIVSLAGSVVLTAESRQWAFYMLPARAWEFAVGGALAVWGARRITGTAIRTILSAGGLACVVTAAFTFDDATAFPGWVALLPVLGTAAVIAAGTSGSAPGGPVLTAGPLPWLGRRSYVLYLWHWPLLVLVPIAIGDRLTAGERLLVCALAVGLADVTHRVLERPVHTSRWLVERPRRALVTGAALTAGALVVAAVSFAAAPSVKGAGAAVGPSRPTSVAEVERALTLAVDTHRAPRNLVPALASVADDIPSYVGRGCNVDLAAATLAPRRCVFGDRTSKRRIVLLGDSHAGQWFDALELIAKERGWALIPMTKSSCPAADVVIIKDGERRLVCEEYHRRAMARIRELKPELVVMASSVAYGAAAEPESWESGYVATMRAIGDSSKSVLLLGDTPRPRYDVPLCVSENLDDVRVCVKSRSELIDPEHRAAEIRAARTGGATFVDPTAWACVEECPVVVGKILVWRDTNHLSTHYVRWLTSALDGAIDQAA